ncbi:MAG: hypothetical protein PHC58_03635 [Candidatus Omnitrophica bacterium]|nr:hypothetical protein [Candidatus Omnitrophota bacterium]
MKKKQIRKQKWLKSEIIKIKLNPEQTVLSCCDSVNRAMFTTFASLRFCSGPYSARCGTLAYDVSS